MHTQITLTPKKTYFFLINLLKNCFSKYRTEKHWPVRRCWFWPNLCGTVIFWMSQHIQEMITTNETPGKNILLNLFTFILEQAFSHKKYKLSNVDKFQKAQRSSFMKSKLNLRIHLHDPPLFCSKDLRSHIVQNALVDFFFFFSCY